MKRGLLSLLTICLLVVAGCGGDGNGGPGPGPGPGSQPTITSMTPSSVSRGQANVTGRIQGTNLGGAVSVNLGDGITVSQVSSVSSVEIEIHFSVSVSASAGARTITVTTSGGTATVSALLTVDSNRAPTAKFKFTPSSGAKNTTFTFDATDSSDPETTITFEWDFGDNKTGTGRIVTHQFSKAGTFTVTLTVKDGNNASHSIKRSVAIVDGFSPVARYTSTPPSGDEDTLFRFDGSPSTDKDGTIVRFEWRLGDGTQATGETVTHKYNESGVYTVKLTVVDNDGLEAAISKELSVDRFDDQEAKDKMVAAVIKFFERFSDLETLPAEEIVEGWSESPDCPGRDREIGIILDQQRRLLETNATIIGEFDVFVRPDHITGNVQVKARFVWIEKNGTHGEAEAVHDFFFRYEGGKWLICNFSLDRDMSAIFQTE